MDPAVDINSVTVCAFSTYAKSMVLPHLCILSHFIVSCVCHINDIHVVSVDSYDSIFYDQT